MFSLARMTLMFQYTTVLRDVLLDPNILSPLGLHTHSLLNVMSVKSWSLTELTLEHNHVSVKCDMLPLNHIHVRITHL